MTTKEETRTLAEELRAIQRRAYSVDFLALDAKGHEEELRLSRLLREIDSKAGAISRAASALEQAEKGLVKACFERDMKAIGLERALEQEAERRRKKDEALRMAETFIREAGIRGEAARNVVEAARSALEVKRGS